MFSKAYLIILIARYNKIYVKNIVGKILLNHEMAGMGLIFGLADGRDLMWFF